MKIKKYYNGFTAPAISNSSFPSVPVDIYAFIWKLEDCGCELFVKIQTSINRVKPETQNLKMSYITNMITSFCVAL